VPPRFVDQASCLELKRFDSERRGMTLAIKHQSLLMNRKRRSCHRSLHQAQSGEQTNRAQSAGHGPKVSAL
jgi:hypothetical protein